jgi:hypothetical protein
MSNRLYKVYDFFFPPHEIIIIWPFLAMICLLICLPYWLIYSRLPLVVKIVAVFFAIILFWCFFVFTGWILEKYTKWRDNIILKRNKIRFPVLYGNTRDS